MATTSAPHETPGPHGRPGDGAAAARTEELYGRYARTVSGLCSALLRDRVEAEDAAQQTFLSAHRAILNGAVPREPAAWLAAIARNECWSRIRGRMREPLPVGELEAASDRDDPLAEAVRRADLSALWAAIEALPRPQRDALLLREFGGLSYGELGEALAVSGPAVESLLFRARQRLRVQLRAAFASLGGASWLETLSRLLGGAPVAAKVAAIGVGAATVTGGAVVVPQVLETGRRALPPAPAHVRPHRVAKRRPLTAAPVAQASSPVRVGVAAPPVERASGEPARAPKPEGGDRGPSGARDETSDGSSTAVSGSDGGGRDEAGAAPETTALQPGPASVPDGGGSVSVGGSTDGSPVDGSPVDGSPADGGSSVDGSSVDGGSVGSDGGVVGTPDGGSD